MQEDINTKLRNHLNSGIKREADVVYLFVEIGKYLEQVKITQYPLIKFYRNWVVHSQIDRTQLAKDISSALDQALTSSESGDDDATMMSKMLEVVSKEKLKNELDHYFHMTGLPKDVLTVESWKRFIRLLVGVLMDVPIEFNGFTRLKMLQFKKDQDSNWISCEVVDHNGNGIDFMWTQLYQEDWSE